MYSPNETKNHPPFNKRDNNGVERTSTTAVTLFPRLVYSDLNQSGLSLEPKWLRIQSTPSKLLLKTLTPSATLLKYKCYLSQVMLLLVKFLHSRQRIPHNSKLASPWPKHTLPVFCQGRKPPSRLVLVD